jgi:hypothetical protein
MGWTGGRGSRQWAVGSRQWRPPVDSDNSPSPPWGRGWTVAGVFFSRSGPGEGVGGCRRSTAVAQEVRAMLQ